MAALKKIRELYAREWRDFRIHYRRIFLVLLFLFALAAAVFFFVYRGDPQSALARLKPLIKKWGQMVVVPAPTLFFQLVRANLVASFLSLALGVVPFLFLPLLNLAANAAASGALCALIAAKIKSPFLFLAVGILPHGIFEIPAMVLAVTLGFTQCRKSLHRSSGLVILENGAAPEELPFGRLVQSFLLVVLPLLLVAAFIEAFGTPLLIRLALPK